MACGHLTKTVFKLKKGRLLRAKNHPKGMLKISPCIGHLPYAVGS